MLHIPATIGYLRRTIGRELMSFVAFDVDRLTTVLWRVGIIDPPRLIVSRLHVTEQLVRQVEQIEKSTDAARAWLESRCVEVVDNTFISPAVAIRQGHFDAARHAADQLTRGVAHG